MKQLIIFLCVPCCVNAQKLPVSKDGLITYTEVVKMPGITQKLLKEKAVKVITTVFNKVSGTTIQETPGSLVFKGYAFYNINKVGVELPYFFNFTMHILFEEGRYLFKTTEFLDDENMPLEKSLLNPADIYNEEGRVKAAGKETFISVTTALKKVGEDLKINMNVSQNLWFLSSTLHYKQLTY